MYAQIQLTGSSSPRDSVCDLSQWLTREDEFRGRVSVERRPLVPDQMGSELADVLQVALGSSGIGTALAYSVAQWAKWRKPGPGLVIKIKHSDGRSAEVTVRDPGKLDVDQLVERLVSEPDHDPNRES